MEKKSAISNFFQLYAFYAKQSLSGLKWAFQAVSEVFVDRFMRSSGAILQS